MTGTGEAILGAIITEPAEDLHRLATSQRDDVRRHAYAGRRAY